MNPINPHDKQITPETAGELHQRYADCGHLLLWAISTGTRDYGQKFIARPHFIRRGEHEPMGLHLEAASLDEIRAKIPAGMTRLPRDADDDPVIVESWI